MLEIGCGTGHFTGWLAGQGAFALGLDLSAAMVAEARRRLPRLPLVRGDARLLPIRGASVDVALFVATLEFLDDPAGALAEATRVARRGIAIMALNRWSLGGLSRRFGRARKSPLLSRARDLSVGSLRRDLVAAAGPRLDAIRWTSGLFPDGLWRIRWPVPVGGDVVGMAALLRHVRARA